MVVDLRDIIRAEDFDTQLSRKTELLKLGASFTLQTPQEITPSNTPFRVISVSLFIDNYVSGTLTDVRIYRKATTPVWASDTPIVRTTYDNRMIMEVMEKDLSSTPLWIAFSASTASATVDVYYRY